MGKYYSGLPEAERKRIDKQRREREKKLRRHEIIAGILIFVFVVMIVIAAVSCSVGRKNDKAEQESLAALQASIEAEEAARVQEEEERLRAAAESEAEEEARTDAIRSASVKAEYAIASTDGEWSDYVNDGYYCSSPTGYRAVAMRCRLDGVPEGVTGTVSYSVNYNLLGWLDWTDDGRITGYPDGKDFIEAIKMELKGEIADYFDIFYSVLQNDVWTDWVKNGEIAGQHNYGYAVKGLRVSVVKKEDGKETYACGVDPFRPMVALTYDDGPSDLATDEIIATLDKYGVKATFFMIGKQVMLFPEQARSVSEHGHEIGTHTYNHTEMTAVPEAEWEEGFTEGVQWIKDVTGREPVIMRPPSGEMTDEGMAFLGRKSMPAILWSLDTKDWRTRDAQSTAEAVLDSVQDGDIILMHDLYQSTAEATEIFLPELLERGYQIVTVSELSAYRGGMLPGHYYRRFLPVS